MNTSLPKKAQLCWRLFELRTNLIIYEENNLHDEWVDDDNWQVTMLSKLTKPEHNSSSKKDNPAKSNKVNTTCHCFGIRGHLRDDSYTGDQAECTFCKKKGHLVLACEKKSHRKSPGESSAPSLKSGKDLSETTDQDLDIDSVSTYLVKVLQNSFRNCRKLGRSVTNPDGDNTIVLRKREVRDCQGKAMPLVLRKEKSAKISYKTCFCI